MLRRERYVRGVTDPASRQATAGSVQVWEDEMTEEEVEGLGQRVQHVIPLWGSLPEQEQAFIWSQHMPGGLPQPCTQPELLRTVFENLREMLKVSPWSMGLLKVQKTQNHPLHCRYLCTADPSATRLAGSNGGAAPSSAAAAGHAAGGAMHAPCLPASELPAACSPQPSSTLQKRSREQLKERGHLLLAHHRSHCGSKPSS
jgi:hypothetical protein